ncbi:response regulator [bacterium]|nr:response regulator [bacterium]
MTVKNKILIVEDERSLMASLRKKFKLEGFEVLEANDGEKGLEVALKEKPDLILLDVVMPNMDGMTMLKKLRVEGTLKKTPVIFLTNLADVNYVNEAIDLDVFDYLVKSNWRIEDVVKKVKEKLKL